MHALLCSMMNTLRRMMHIQCIHTCIWWCKPYDDGDFGILTTCSVWQTLFDDEDIRCALWWWTSRLNILWWWCCILWRWRCLVHYNENPMMIQTLWWCKPYDDVYHMMLFQTLMVILVSWRHAQFDRPVDDLIVTSSVDEQQWWAAVLRQWAVILKASLSCFWG